MFREHTFQFANKPTLSSRKVKVQSLSCVQFFATMDCGPPGSSVPGTLQAKNAGMGCHFLLQGIFQTQGSNLGLPHCRLILDPLSHPGSLQRLVKYSYRSQVPPLDGEREA